MLRWERRKFYLYISGWLKPSQSAAIWRYMWLYNVTRHNTCGSKTIFLSKNDILWAETYSLCRPARVSLIWSSNDDCFELEISSARGKEACIMLERSVCSDNNIRRKGCQGPSLETSIEVLLVSWVGGGEGVVDPSQFTVFYVHKTSLYMKM